MTKLIPPRFEQVEIPDSMARVRPDPPTHHWLVEEALTSLPLLLVDAIVFVTTIALANAATTFLGFPGPDAWSLAPSIGAVLLILFATSGLYPASALNQIVELRRVFWSTTIAFAACVLYVHGLETAVFAPLPMLVAWLFTTAMLPIARSYARRLLSKTTWWGRHAIVVGNGEPLRTTLGLVDQLRLQGILPTLYSTSLDDDDWLELARLRPRWLIVCSEQPWDRIMGQPIASNFRQVSVLVPSMMRIFGQSWIEAAQVGPTSALHVRNRLHFKRYAIAKRGLDLVACLALAPIVLPVFLVLAILVKITSRGPIFFGHTRLGRDGHAIKIWKFRTMVTDAQERLDKYLAEHPELAAEWEATHKLRKDPRITSIGNFLRKTSLDELPQIWSVLVGQMSLVGPRPIVVDEIRKYGDTYELYKKVTPGITGLWQVSGRNDTSYPERVALDAAYVRNWSIWFDLFVLFRTIKTVLRREGAC